MFRGFPQMPESSEMKAHKWDRMTDPQRLEYTIAIDEWKRDFPDMADMAWQRS